MNKMNKINELGENLTNDTYTCNICGKEAGLSQAKKEDWLYSIKGTPLEEIDQIKIFDQNNVKYVCQDHLNEYGKSETEEFVLIGYPYFISTMINDKNIVTY